LHACGLLNEMLDNEVEPHYQDKKSFYQYRNVRIADMLIENGCNPRLENNLGWNIFHLSAKNNSEQLVRYLISKFSFLINSRDIYGKKIIPY
jgi:ankyrin repeat protein